MQAEPSRTALGVAIRRASHQLYDQEPRVLEDPIAVRILGRAYRAALERSHATIDDPFSVGMRSWLVARSRYAEDKLAEAVARGVRQYVVLGAGLDTFAYRNPYKELQVFEIDHPATQRWKRDLLAAGGLEEPANVRYVPVDFERDSLAKEMSSAGLDLSAPAVFAWLGVVLYLTQTAFRATLGVIEGFPAGSGVVMDYAQPVERLPLEERAGRIALAQRVSEAGEPFQLYFTVEEMAAELERFGEREDLGTAELTERYFSGRKDGLAVRGASGRMVCGWRTV